MKKHQLHIQGFCLALIYILSMAAGTLKAYGFVGKTDFSQHQKLELHAKDGHVQPHTTPSEIIDVSGNALTKSLDLEDKQYASIIGQKHWKHGLNQAFKQYVANSLDIHIAYRIKAIIYPFHYYW